MSENWVPDPSCRWCDGSGTVLEEYEYGDDTVRQPFACACLAPAEAADKETCGFSHWQCGRRAGKTTATCTCGWTSAEVWKHRETELKAVEKLREHVMRGWA